MGEEEGQRWAIQILENEKKQLVFNVMKKGKLTKKCEETSQMVALENQQHSKWVKGDEFLFLWEKKGCCPKSLDKSFGCASRQGEP